MSEARSRNTNAKPQGFVDLPSLVNSMENAGRKGIAGAGCATNGVVREQDRVLANHSAICEGCEGPFREVDNRDFPHT